MRTRERKQSQTQTSQAGQRVSPNRNEQLKARLSGNPPLSRFGHNFSQVRVHRPVAGAISTKLAINKPGDEYEREADEVADRVMGIPNLRSKPIQTKLQANDRAGIEAPSIVDDVLRSPGQPLDQAARVFFESRLGHDLSVVRIHTDAEASAAALSMNALAFTVGRDVVFGAGQYAPDTASGRRLLGHELTHVVQQQVAHPSTTHCLQRQPSGSTQTRNAPVGKITTEFDQKVVDQYLWPSAWASTEWVKSVPVGREVWDQLEQGGAILSIKFVAERTDIPVKGADTLGYYEESTGTVYVLVGVEDYYMRPTATGSVEEQRIKARGAEEISNTLFHELLHAWFTMTFPGHGTGHKAGATPIGDPKFDPKGYDPVFLERLQRFEKEFRRSKEKLKGP